MHKRIGFKVSYTLGDRHLPTFTDIEPDCSDLDIKCQRDIETSNKEVDEKYNSIITEEVKKYKLAQTPLVSAKFEEKLTLYISEPRASFEHDVEENKDICT